MHVRTVNIPSVVNLSQRSAKSLNKTVERRQFAVVHGLCMYQSTGGNSGAEGTWFPFFGLHHKGHPYYQYHGKAEPDGFLYKPISLLKATGKLKDYNPEDHFPPAVYAKMMEVFKEIFKNNKRDIRKEIAFRFCSFYIMMVSSQFGGGIWDTPEGKTFKKWLEQSYPNFYQNFPKLKPETGPEMTDGIEVNQWLLHQGGDFKKIPLKTKVFTAPLKDAAILGKPKKGTQEYVISWLKFVPDLAKKVTTELPEIKLPSFSVPSVSLPAIALPSFKLRSEPLPDNIAKTVYVDLQSTPLERKALLEPAMEKLIKLSKNKKMDEPTRKQAVIRILAEVCS